MGCIPAMALFYGVVGCSPFPLLLIFAILVRKQKRWARIPYIFVVSLISIAAVILLADRVRYAVKEAGRDKSHKTFRQKIEAANRDTHYIVRGKTTLSNIEGLLGPPIRKKTYTYGKIEYVYRNEALCSRVVDSRYRNSYLVVRFDAETSTAESYNCTGKAR